MAKCMNPAMSTETRGRVAGIVYNTWRGTRYIKSQTSPAQPRTKLQLQMRAWTTILVRAWQGLTDAQRTSWNDYAVAHPDVDWTNSPKRLTGMNWWTRNNIRAWLAGQQGYVSVPTVPAPDAVASFAAANGAGESVVTWVDPGGDPGHLDIWMLGPHSAGVLAKIQRAKHKAMANRATETETITGLIAGTYTFWARVIDDNTGLVSTWVSDTATVT